jgi:hypothetical protein
MVPISAFLGRRGMKCRGRVKQSEASPASVVTGWSRSWLGRQLCWPALFLLLNHVPSYVLFPYLVWFSPVCCLFVSVFCFLLCLQVGFVGRVCMLSVLRLYHRIYFLLCFWWITVSVPVTVTVRVWRSQSQSRGHGPVTVFLFEISKEYEDSKTQPKASTEPCVYMCVCVYVYITMITYINVYY